MEKEKLEALRRVKAGGSKQVATDKQMSVQGPRNGQVKRLAAAAALGQCISGSNSSNSGPSD